MASCITLAVSSMRLSSSSSVKFSERRYDAETSRLSSTVHIEVTGVRGSMGLVSLQNELSKSPERGILNIELKFPGTSRGELGWDAADFTFAGVREIGRRFVPSSAFPAGRHGARVDEDGFTARSV